MKHGKVEGRGGRGVGEGKQRRGRGWKVTGKEIRKQSLLLSGVKTLVKKDRHQPRKQEGKENGGGSCFLSQWLLLTDEPRHPFASRNRCKARFDMCSMKTFSLSLTECCRDASRVGE